MADDAKVTSIAAIWEAAKKLNAEISGVSWGGFNVAGDRKSIDEVRRLMHLEDRLRWFEREYAKLLESLPMVGESRSENKNEGD